MASQWIARSIPNYNNLVVNLQDILETALKMQSRRTKKVASRIDLSQFGWTDIHTDQFNNLKHAISQAVELAYPNQDMIQCVYCDASNHASSGIVTQFPPDDLNKPLHDQRHQPLRFLVTDLMALN